MSKKIIITPETGFFDLNFRELWEYRELIGLLAWRDITPQYKQAFFGVAWAVIRPLFSVLVFTLVFSKVAGLSSSGIPYPLFTLCGITAWGLFASILEQSTQSVLNNSNLITRTIKQVDKNTT